MINDKSIRVGTNEMRSFVSKDSFGFNHLGKIILNMQLLWIVFAMVWILLMYCIVLYCIVLSCFFAPEKIMMENVRHNKQTMRNRRPRNCKGRGLMQLPFSTFQLPRSRLAAGSEV